MRLRDLQRPWAPGARACAGVGAPRAARPRSAEGHLDDGAGGEVAVTHRASQHAAWAVQASEQALAAAPLRLRCRGWAEALAQVPRAAREGGECGGLVGRTTGAQVASARRAAEHAAWAT